MIIPCPACRKPTTKLVLDEHGRCAACVRDADAGLSRERELAELADQERAAAEEEKRRNRTPKDLVQQELARRELARRHLLPFVKRFNDSYDAGWVHRIICDELEAFEEAVVQKKSPRLIIEIPPRHGKSELVSRMFPAWFLGRNPKLEVIAASHTTSLAMDFSRKVRSVFRSEAFGTVFREARISEDSQAAEHWRTSHGGGYTAVGVGSAVVGKGASALLIDDPVSGSEDAESFNAREAIKNWYQTEAYTRLAPGGGVMIIMQRWHDEDLSGWLQARADKGEGEEWRVVRFPALAEEDEPYRKKGEPLHPSRYSLELLNNIRRNMTPRQWEALYQQRPVPDSGSYFKTEYFRFYKQPDLPPLSELKVYQAWDLAIGQNEQNDYTAGITIGLSRNDDIYVLDVQHGRWSAMEIVEKILDGQRAHGAEMVGVEKGHIQMALGPYLSKRRSERRQHAFLLHELRPGRRDKQTRARAIQGRMEQGKVFFPENAPWLGATMREMLRFPAGQNDDRVDAMAWVGLMLEEMVPSRAAAPKPTQSWRDKLRSSTHTTKSAMSA